MTGSPKLQIGERCPPGIVPVMRSHAGPYAAVRPSDSRRAPRQRAEWSLTSAPGAPNFCAPSAGRLPLRNGRHRYEPRCKLGVEPVTREWAGECGSPEAFAVASNLATRT